MGSEQPILQLHNIEVKYHEVILVLKGVSIEVKAGGIVRHQESFPKRKRLVTHIGRRLELGGRSDSSFDGLLDELRVSAAVLGDEVPLHESILIEGKPFMIHFDEKGFLDRDFHRGPVDISFTHAGRRRYKVTVGLMGEVR